MPKIEVFHYFQIDRTSLLDPALKGGVEERCIKIAIFLTGNPRPLGWSFTGLKAYSSTLAYFSALQILATIKIPCPVGRGIETLPCTRLQMH
jgi:hypothetical protein